MNKTPKLLTDPQIAVMVDKLANGKTFRVANASQRTKVLYAAKFQGKRVSTRRNEDNTFTVFALEP